MQFRGLASPCLSSSTSNSTSLLQNPKGHQSLYPCDIHMMAMGFLPSCVILCTQIRDQKYSNKGKYVVHKRCIGQPMKSRCVVKPEIVLSFDVSDVTFNGPRVFVLSDLHTDYSENMAWIKSISTLQYKKDVLLVAGDVAETYTNFISTMSILKDRFEHVFYVPGNHDLWCRRKEDEFLDSVVKLDKLLTACRELGVKTSPDIIDGLGIVPLFSWYHESFDNEKDITSIRIPSLEMACKDYHACKWPGQLSSRDLSLALYFDAMNETIDDQIEEIQTVCRQIISFSHFVPRQELCPEKRMLFYPNLPKIIGSDCLEIRIRSIHGTSGSISACHVFGHTHFCWDAVLDGIRYVQAPLAYPRERKRRMNGGENWLPFCVYANNALTSKREPCFWSDYYSNNARDPENVELAPWVAKFYGR